MKTRIYILLVCIILPLFANAEVLRVEINDLKENIPDYKVIDVRDKESFSLAHIKGALNFPVSLTYQNLNVDGKVIIPSKMQTVARDLGLDINDKIVIYDAGSFYDAARLFWTLEVYGFKDVKLLNAGFNEWESKGFPVSNEPREVKKSNYIAAINNQRLSTKFTTQIATKNPNQVIIDAREYNSYIGKKSSAKRFGHIPKALHIPAIHNLNPEEQRLKDSNDLKDLYKDISKDKKVLIYCAVGRIASTNYFALRELGYNVSNYDASWKEWGNDFALPIVNKSKE